MHQIAPELCSLEGLKETNMERRAEAVIEAASKLECDQFVSKTEILQVNPVAEKEICTHLIH